MVQTPLPALADDDRPFPRVPELVRLSFRIDQLLTSDDEQDARLAARSLDYVTALTAELDRVRPHRRANRQSEKLSFSDRDPAPRHS